MFYSVTLALTGIPWTPLIAETRPLRE